MQQNVAIWVKNAKSGKNANWIILEAYAGFFDANRIYRIEFCGTEANSSIPLLEKENEKLALILAKDFGYGPYNLETVNAIIGEGKQYNIMR